MTAEQLTSMVTRFFDQCGKGILQGIIVLAIGFVLFSLLQKVFWLNRIKKPWAATWLDLRYALLAMLYPPSIYFILSAGLALMSVQLIGTPHNPQASLFVIAGQLAIFLFARDCLIYLRHRIFHLGPVWVFHSIHHSSEAVDWISAVRFHPVESLIESSGETLLVLGAVILGFHPTALLIASIIIVSYNFLVHSNLRWTFGPLRYIFVSPVFHRWHHSDTPAATDKNFAAMFSCLDWLFGTYYMPKGLTPKTLGLSAAEKTNHPRTLTGQLLYPFRKH